MVVVFPVFVTKCLPWFGFVISPITVALMPSFCRLSMMVCAFSGSAVMSRAPELMSWSGSMLKCLQICLVSVGIRICFS